MTKTNSLASFGIILASLVIAACSGGGGGSSSGSNAGDNCWDAQEKSGSGDFSYHCDANYTDSESYWFFNDVWFAWTATQTGLVIADTCGSTNDTLLAAYSGSCSSLIELAFNDFTECGPQVFEWSSRISFSATAGATYFIRVGNDYQGYYSSGYLNVYQSALAAGGDDNGDVGTSQEIHRSGSREAASIHRAGYSTTQPAITDQRSPHLEMGAQRLSSLGIPCGEVVNYCVTSPNSASSTGALIGIEGDPMLHSEPLVLHARELPPGEVGFFLHGPMRGDPPIVFGSGHRCVSPLGQRRIDPPTPTGDGECRATLDTALMDLELGGVRYFQFWYRDSRGDGHNLTDAIAVTLCP